MAESTPKSKAPSTSRAGLSGTPPNDAVSCLQNPETGSVVWLVGIIHQAAPYIEVTQPTQLLECWTGGRSGRYALVGVGILGGGRGRGRPERVSER